MIQYKKELEKFLENKFFIISLLLTAFLCYGFSALNLTVSIDDFRGEQYIGSGKEFLSAGRFGMTIWPWLLGYKTQWPQNAFVIEIIAVVLFAWSAVNFCILFSKASKGNISSQACAGFSCLLISYPLINEIWEYTNVNLSMCISFFLISITLLIIYNQLQNTFKPWEYFVCSVFMMIVCSSYEALVPVYILAVFSVLLVETLFGTIEKGKHFKYIVINGCFYAGVLVLGIILRTIIHKILMVLFEIPRLYNGATGIMWGTASITEILANVFHEWVDYYLLRSIIYFPLTEMLVCVILFILLILLFVFRTKIKSLFFLGVGILSSLIILTFVQGSLSPYRTTCQVLAFFIAFTGMLLINQIEKQQHFIVRLVIASFIIIVTLNQSIQLNYYLTLNHIRSEEEMDVIRNIGRDLQEMNCISDKPVVFVGEYTLSSNVQESASIKKTDFRWEIYSKLYGRVAHENCSFTRKLPHTNINSVITWALDDQTDLQMLFSFCGIEYKPVLNEDLKQSAQSYAIKNELSAYPQNGYIEELDDFVLVNLK